MNKLLIMVKLYKNVTPFFGVIQLGFYFVILVLGLFARRYWTSYRYSVELEF
jgi:hypothetical protein